MNPLSELFDARLPAGLGGRWYGVFPALSPTSRTRTGKAASGSACRGRPTRKARPANCGRGWRR